jgi:hypothetical protein
MSELFVFKETKDEHRCKTCVFGKTGDICVGSREVPNTTICVAESQYRYLCKKNKHSHWEVE